MSRIMKRWIALAVLLVFAVMGSAGACAAEQGGKAPAAGASVPEITDYSGLSGRTVSMLTGAPFEELVRSKAPDVGEFSFFNNVPDMLLAMKAGKTDAVLINNAIAVLAVNRDSALALFPQDLQDGAFGFAFTKGDPRRDVWQAAYDAIPQAQIEAAWEKWTGADESVKTLPEQDWPGANGTVRVAACDTLEPMSYAGEGGALVGFDLEVLLMIARALDVRVEFSGMEFSAILSSVQSGKADIGVGSIIITAERAESVDFVEYYPAAFVLIVRGTQTGSAAGLSELAHARAAVQTGTICGEAAQAALPDIRLEYYNSQADCMAALLSGNVDLWSVDEPIARHMILGNDELEIAGTFDSSSLAAAFPQTDACQVICGIFKRSPVFRIGGDEFAVIAQGNDYASIEELLGKLSDHNTEALRTGGVVIACGMARYENDESVAPLFERADQNMYENKNSLKSVR